MKKKKKKYNFIHCDSIVNKGNKNSRMREGEWHSDNCTPETI